jgi:hypothetical protein
MRSFGYSLYWHFAYFCSAGNFRGNHQNVFPDIGDANVLAVPGERGIEPKLQDDSDDWQAAYRLFRACP